MGSAPRRAGMLSASHSYRGCVSRILRRCLSCPGLGEWSGAGMGTAVLPATPHRILSTFQGK